ncbi:MAG TPA: 3-phosphoshikimate 1-carboxyvinyltransferase, partial [Acidimicrobiales bacterium]
TGPTPVRGRLRVPGDKSVSHRALLLGALAGGTTTITGLSAGGDVARTRSAVEALGAAVDEVHGEVRVTGGRLHEPAAVLDVGNSGTAIRLLAGVCAGVDGISVLAGDASVAARPMDRVAAPLRAMGATVDGRGGGRWPPLVVRGGRLRGIDYELPVPSAQVKGAVLLAGLAADGETVVRERAATRAHTEELLAAFGADVAVDREAGTVRLRPSRLRGTAVAVPGDPSQAAFWVVAACAVPGADLVVEDLYLGPARAGFLDVLARMGADLEVDRRAGAVRARGGPLKGIDVGGDEVPGLVDEVPALAVAAACADGESRFTGLGELRLKESDRLATVAAMLLAFGAGVAPLADGFVVAGGGGLRGAVVDAAGDHRIAMAAAVAGLAAAGETTVTGWDAVATSYPGFEEDLRRCTP